MDAAAAKQALRHELRRLRAGGSRCQRQAAAAQAARQAWRLPWPRRGWVGVYLSTPQELDTQPLIRTLRRAGLQLAAPVIGRGQRLHFLPLGPTTPLRRGPWGLREPARGRPLPVRRLHTVIMPLLGFDERGTRLGMGGGYYDRWLAGPAAGGRPRRIGYAFSRQGRRQLPAEAWDIPLQALVCERGILRFSTFQLTA